MHPIYVFGSTGNSLWIAKEMAEALKQRDIAAEARIESIPVLMRQGEWKIRGETVGFVFPCYYGTVPRIVTDFVAGAASIDSPYLWAFASGGGTVGTSLSGLNAKLGERGKELSAGAGAAIASNYVNGWYYRLIQPAPRQLAARLGKARAAVTELADTIATRGRKLPRENALLAKIPELLTPARYIADTRPWASEFSATDRCVGCGICEAMCPVENIRMETKEGAAAARPRFGASCERCMACFQFCPNGALAIRGKRIAKPKYLNPNVTKEELRRFNRP